MNPDSGFWRDRRVLLTGHTGFKGAWAAIWLARLGARVIGLSLVPDTEPSLWAGIGSRVIDEEIIGGLVMAFGHFLMTSEDAFYFALAAIAIGNGLFLPSLPSQVGDLYQRDDPRRSWAFNVYYVGINIGGFLAPLICGTLGELYGWHYGFGAAGVSQAVLVADRAFAHVGDDLHVRVRVRREAGLRRDGVVVPHAQRAPAHAIRVVVAGEGEMVFGVEPAVVGSAQAVEGSAFNHGVAPHA